MKEKIVKKSNGINFSQLILAKNTQIKSSCRATIL